MVSSREKVVRVLEGNEGVVAFHIEADEKDIEYAFGDIVGVGAKFKKWRSFYAEGGPFHRKANEKLGEWVERIDLDAYEWPSLSEFVEESVRYFEENAKKYSQEKFVLFKVLGPTETAEGFFAPKVPQKLKHLLQISHRFDFAVFSRLNPSKAVRIYDKIASYILELVKAGSEIDYVDAIRVADDVADYRGPLYPPVILERYYYWHSLFTSEAKKCGKYVFLHCDGDLRKRNLIQKLSTMYDGLHPLDLMPKSTVGDALKWIQQIIEVRKEVGWSVTFFTGLPVDLLFSKEVDVKAFVKVVQTLLEKHGARKLVLSTTHSNYPATSYRDKLVMEKIKAVKALCANL